MKKPKGKAAPKPIPPNKPALLALLYPFAESDVLCYRADNAPELAARQAVEWQPILDWAQQHYHIIFTITAGIIHVAQPAATIARLKEALTAFSAAQLVPMHTLITMGGSLVTALMVAEGALDADTAFDVCHLDELWQVSLWGEDWLATETRAARKAEYITAAQMLKQDSSRLNNCAA